MNLIKPYAKLMDVPDKNAGIRLLKKIEWCGRISHRSEEAQTDTSWDKFIRSVVIQHGDWSIVEHASASVDMYVDRGITHEIVRHRLFSFTQECITGDTHLIGKLTIKQVYEQNLVGHAIKSSDGRFVIQNKIAHIFKRDHYKHVYEVRTKFGYKIRATKEHRFQTPDGQFITLGNLNVGSEVNVNGRLCLLKLNDTTLKSLFLKDGLNAHEIAEREQVPYSTVTRRLRSIGISRDYRNDKNPEKYNKNHTQKSYEKMGLSIREGYANGRKVWNKGLHEDDYPGIKKQAKTLRKHHHDNQPGELNSCWKGGVSATLRRYARNKKSNIKLCEVCGKSRIRLEVHHIDENPMNDVMENLLKLCNLCHKKVHGKFKIGTEIMPDVIVNIKYSGFEEVYDLEMIGLPNYIADGFVVHNSTRFVNYEKKMEPNFIKPDGINGEDNRRSWYNAIQQCEESYKELITQGISPQIARSVFPNALASRIIVTGNLRNWRHFFIMRTTIEAHPQMREVTIPLLEKFKDKIPILFDDIEPMTKQSESMKKGR